MAVTCALFGPLRDAAGRKHVEVPADPPSTVIEVVRALAVAYPQVEEHLFGGDGRLRSINVTLNGDHIEHLDGLETAVADGDVIRLAPPVTGGTAR